MRNWLIKGESGIHKNKDGILKELDRDNCKFIIEYSNGDKFIMTIDNFYDKNGNPYNEPEDRLLYFSDGELVYL